MPPKRNHQDKHRHNQHPHVAATTRPTIAVSKKTSQRHVIIPGKDILQIVSANILCGIGIFSQWFFTRPERLLVLVTLGSALSQEYIEYRHQKMPVSPSPQPQEKPSSLLISIPISLAIGAGFCYAGLIQPGQILHYAFTFCGVNLLREQLFKDRRTPSDSPAPAAEDKVPEEGKVMTHIRRIEVEPVTSPGR